MVRALVQAALAAGGAILAVAISSAPGELPLWVTFAAAGAGAWGGIVLGRRLTRGG